MAIWVANLRAIAPRVIPRRVSHVDAVAGKPFICDVNVGDLEVQNAPRFLIGRRTVGHEDGEIPVVADRRRRTVRSLKLDFEAKVLDIPPRRESMLSDEDREMVEVGHRASLPALGRLCEAPGEGEPAHPSVRKCTQRHRADRMPDVYAPSSPELRTAEPPLEVATRREPC